MTRRSHGSHTAPSDSIGYPISGGQGRTDCSSSRFPCRSAEWIVRRIEKKITAFDSARKARQVPFRMHCGYGRLETIVVTGLLDFYLAMIQKLEDAFETLSPLGITFWNSMQETSGVGKHFQHGLRIIAHSRRFTCPQRWSSYRGRSGPHTHRRGNWRPKSANLCLSRWTTESTQLGVRPPPSWRQISRLLWPSKKAR